MGFKRVNLKELETSMSPAFLGLPLKHIEEAELLKITQKEQKISKIEEESNVFLLNEEILEYNYDKNGEIVNFIGSGNITVINSSKKDRIWDVRLTLSETQNINIKSEDVIKLGNFEPKTNKVINYSIFAYEKLPDPVKITELIEVLNITAEKIKSEQDNLMEDSDNLEIKDVDLDLTDKKPESEIPKIDKISVDPKEEEGEKRKDTLEKESSVKKEVNDEFDSQISSINSKLDIKKGNLEEINKKLNEWPTKKKKLKISINKLEKKYNILLKAKSKALSMRLKQIPEEAKIEKTSEYENLIKEVKSQISEKEEEIIKIEEEYSEKEVILKEEVDLEYNPQIESVKAEINVEQENLDEIIKELANWTKKKEDLNDTIKSLKKKHRTLIKTKSKALSSILKEISGDEINSKKIEEEVDLEYNPQIESVEAEINIEQEDLDELIRELANWTKKKEDLNETIKLLKKKHGTLIKTKSKALSSRLKGTSGDEDSLKRVEKEVEDAYGPQINSEESKLRVEQEKLDEAIKISNECITKKKELSNTIKLLKKKHGTLIKAKSKALNTRLKEISGDEISSKKVEEEVDLEYNPQIESVEAEINVEQENLDETLKELANWTKKKELNVIIKDLKKTLKALNKEKSRTLNTKLKEINEEKKIKINEVRNQISTKEDEITKIEKGSSKKEASVKKEVEIAYDPKIDSVKSKLDVEQKNFDEKIKKADELAIKKNELIANIKNLKRTQKSLLKAKSKALSKRLKEISEGEKTEKSSDLDEKDNEIIKIEEEYSMKEASVKKEVEEEFDPQINSVESKLSVEQENLNKATKNFAEWNAKEKDISDIIKNLNKKRKNLLKTKSKALIKRLKKIPEEEKIEKVAEEEPSIKEIKSQINKKEEEIKKIEEEYLKKEATLKKEVEHEFNPQINGVERKLSAEQEKLDETIKISNECITKKNELSNTIKTIKKKHGTLIKTKSKALSSRLKGTSGDEISSKKVEEEVDLEYNPQLESVEAEINVGQENLDEAIKKLANWTKKKEGLNETIKSLKKKHGTLIKTKSKALSSRLKEISGDEISLKKVEEEVDLEYNPQIESVEAEINVGQENLDEAIKKLANWTKKKEDLNETIKSLKKKHGTLIKTKSKALSSRLKGTSGDEDSLKRVEKEVEDAYGPQINSEESKLRVEQENLDETIKISNECITKKKELSNTIKSLKKKHGTLIKTKSKALNTRLKEILEEKKIKIKEIRSQISEKEDKITKLKKKPSKKVDSIENEVENEYDLQIMSVESKLSVEQEKLNEIIKNANEWKIKMKELNTIIKILKRKHKNLFKTKSKALNKKLKEINEEKQIKINEINEEIKKKKTKDLAYSFEESALRKRERLMQIEFEETSDEESESKMPEKIQESELKKIDLQVDLEDLQSDIISSKVKEKVEEKEEIKEEEPIILESDKLDVKNNLIFLYNQKNTLKFTINLENTTKYTMENIIIGKIFSDEFTNFKYESKTISNIELIKNNIICSIKELKPNEKINIVIFADINLKEKKIIGTGRIQLSYLYKDYLISGIDFKDFTAYSHAIHAIKIKEKETEPNLWECSLIFKNNSDLDMELRSILVLDEKKQNKFIDLDLGSEKSKKIVKPGEKFVSKGWEVKDNNEPKYYRKLGYSITHKIENSTKITIRFEEDIFEIVDLDISKRFSETEIKSFEEAEIESFINIKNIGTISVKGLMIIDVIPSDFRPPSKLSDFKIRTSLGKKVSENLKIKISPNNQDPTVPHIIELKINLDGTYSDAILDVNEFLEIRYQFNAISPNYNKTYEFPLNINSYYPKEKINTQNYYCIENSLSKNEQPDLKILHLRRDLLISKEIFPGRTVDEFVINIIINNNSNIELNDINIKDTISKSFELLNSNVKYTISESESGEDMTISVTLDRILPYQESEIRYYVKNKSGEKIDYDELESFIFG